MTNGYKILVYKNYEYRIFSLFNFPRAAIFMTSWLPLLLKIDILLYAAIGQPYDVIFKIAEIGDIHIQFLCTLKLYFNLLFM